MLGLYALLRRKDDVSWKPAIRDCLWFAVGVLPGLLALVVVPVRQLRKLHPAAPGLDASGRVGEHRLSRVWAVRLGPVPDAAGRFPASACS
jgi:hypothetical protein